MKHVGRSEFFLKWKVHEDKMQVFYVVVDFAVKKHVMLTVVR